jgi:hypothetical protein
MATWTDIERASSKIEQLDRATLEQFLAVAPPGSSNPNFIVRRDHLLQRIHRRHDHLVAAELSQQTRQNQSEDRWYKKPVGIIALTVGGGLLLALIKILLGI